MGMICSKMAGINSIVDHLIECNFSKFKNWAQVKCNPVIQFKEFSNISEKIELYDAEWSTSWSGVSCSRKKVTEKSSK